MSLELSGAREALTAIFQTRTLRRGNGQTSPCGLSPKGGRLEEGGAAIQQRAQYTLTLPGDTTVELDHDEVVTVDEVEGREFRVIHAPAPSNLRLSRAYLVEEVG